MAGFSTGMARMGGEREGAVWYGWGSAALDQELEEVVLGNLVLPDNFPRHESRAGSISHLQCIGPRPLLGVIVVRKVTRFLQFNKGIGDLFQPRHCWIRPAKEFAMDNTLRRLFHWTMLECPGQRRPMVIASPITNGLSDEQVE